MLPFHVSLDGFDHLHFHPRSAVNEFLVEYILVRPGRCGNHAKNPFLLAFHKQVDLGKFSKQFGEHGGNYTFRSAVANRIALAPVV